MVAVDDFPDTLSIIEVLVDEIDDSIDDDISGQTEEVAVEGYRCTHGEHRYVAVTATPWQHIAVQYKFRADPYWYAHESPDHSLGSDDEIQVPPEEMESARRGLERELQDQPTAPKRELLMNLKQVLAREGCAVNFDTITDPYNIHGFTVTRNVFPNRGEFLTGEFHDAVQNVINFGWTGQDLLLDYYGLYPDSDAGTPGI